MPIKLNGATNGSVELNVPAAVGSDLQLTLPATAGEVIVKATDGSVDLGSVDIDSSGRLLVGTSSARTNYYPTDEALTPSVQFEASRGGLAVRGTSGGADVFIGNGSTVTAASTFLGEVCFTGFDGTNNRTAARILCQTDAACGSGDMPGRLVFSTTADGASSPTERFRLQSNGVIGTGSLYSRTTAAAANVYVDSGTDLYRSTSSIKYKTEVETIQDAYADAILNVRPVWYRSTCDGDNGEHAWWGFIAEEVAEIDPRLVHWKTKKVTYDEKGSIVLEPCDPEPEGVAYERFVPHLLNLIKRQQAAIETLETKVASLEASS